MFAFHHLDQVSGYEIKCKYLMGKRENKTIKNIFFLNQVRPSKWCLKILVMIRLGPTGTHFNKSNHIPNYWQWAFLLKWALDFSLPFQNLIPNPEETSRQPFYFIVDVLHVTQRYASFSFFPRWKRCLWKAEFQSFISTYCDVVCAHVCVRACMHVVPKLDSKAFFNLVSFMKDGGHIAPQGACVKCSCCQHKWGHSRGQRYFVPLGIERLRLILWTWVSARLSYAHTH